MLTATVCLAFDGETRRLSSSATGESVYGEFSPEGEWIVFNAYDPVEENAVLYATRRWVDSPFVRLSPPTTPHFALDHDFAIARQEYRVLFRSDVTGDGYPDLSSVLIWGPWTGSQRLSPDAVPGGRVYDFAISPNGLRAVFWGDLAETGTLELWTVRTNGSTSAVRLHDPLATGQGVGSYFRFSHDGSRVLFLGEIDATNGFALWSAPVDASSAPVRLSPERTAGFGGVSYPPAFVQSGNRVLYLGDFVDSDGFELWSSPVDGSGPPVRLDSPGASVDVTVGSFVAGGVGNRVVFDVRDQSIPRFDLFSVPRAGPATSAVRLSPPTDGGPNTVARLSASGSHVLFTGAYSQPFVNNLYSVPIQGPWTSYVQLSPDYPSGESLGLFSPSPDEDFVVFSHSGPGAGDDLWSVPVTGPSGAAVRLSPLVPGSSVTFNDWFVAVGSRVVFLVEGFSEDELWSAPLDGSEPAFRLHGDPPGPGGARADSIRIASGSPTVIFCGNLRSAEDLDLFAANAADPTIPTRTLNPDPPAGGGADCSARLFSDGTGVVFAGEFEVDERYDLWISDEMIFGSDFDEESNTSEWTLTQP